MPANIADAVPRLKRLIPRLRGKRIGVLGDLMLDRYLWGTASRLSPEAAVPIVDFVEQSECLGGAGNVAANISTLGGEVEAFGVIGNDEAGRALQKCLSAANIAAKGIIADSKRVTTVKTRIIARHQQVVRVDHERRESLRAETQEKLLRRSLVPDRQSILMTDSNMKVLRADTDLPADSAQVPLEIRRMFHNADQV